MTASHLVIVESPNKVKKVQAILGDGYVVRASKGHICDLPKDDLGIDMSSGTFEETYEVLPGHGPIITDLKKLANAAHTVYLATDPDREGEAIAWHIARMIGTHPRIRRVTFNQITADAVRQAFNHSRPIDDQLVNAQRTRRVIDRLVGYEISPILREAQLQPGAKLSAGRVQTATLKMLVALDLERQHFQSRTYWTLLAHLDHSKGPVTAKLMTPAAINKPEDLDAIMSALEQADTWWISEMVSEIKDEAPPAPFTTSTLQQEASRRLKLKPKQTDAAAQVLFEAGLITYHRTDSTHVAPEAQAQARSLIEKLFSPNYLPPAPPQHLNRNTNAQEAHEAIRPSHLEQRNAPPSNDLDAHSKSLYGLIWQRFIASQMAAARFNIVSVYIQTAKTGRPLPYAFLARARTPLFDGYQRIYTETPDEDDEADDVLSALPAMRKGDRLHLDRLQGKEIKTKPPRPFTQARLIAHMERVGIGRPSTYSNTIETLQDRGYAVMQKHYIVPTQLGQQVLTFLCNHFPTLFEVGFTAQMEGLLDQIASGQGNRFHVLRAFHSRLTPEIQAAREHARQMKPPTNGEACPKCNHDLVLRHGRNGLYWGCVKYPICSYSRKHTVTTSGRPKKKTTSRRSRHHSQSRSSQQVSAK